MKVFDQAQRELKPHRVDHLLKNFDLDLIGMPVLNARDGHFYIIDGQHRVEALKQFLGPGWETQKIPCRVYDGLSEEEEADMFDRLNDAMQVSTFDKFRVRVTASRNVESTINDVVIGLGLKITRLKNQGGICAVGTLVKVYERSDAEVLQRSLRIIRDAYGDAGLEAAVIDGLGHVCQRYNGALDEKVAVNRLGEARGGVKGLLNKATVIQKQTGKAKSQCVAAAAVDIINQGSRKKLKSWWKTAEEAV
jgi:hypothetical protein